MTAGILDTSVVIRLGSLRESDLPDEAHITAITLAELGVGPLVTADPAERARRQQHLQQAEADFEPIPFDAAAARVFAGVASELRAGGRKTAARAYDAMIAAIAISRGMPVYTTNPADFEGISGVRVEQPGGPDLD